MQSRANYTQARGRRRTSTRIDARDRPQNFQLKLAATKYMPRCGNSPTMFPRPPKAIGTEPCWLTSSVPPYRYSNATPQLKVLLDWCCAPMPKRHAESAGSVTGTVEPPWNFES